jgi:hypothetical protein
VDAARAGVAQAVAKEDMLELAPRRATLEEIAGE